MWKHSIAKMQSRRLSIIEQQLQQQQQMECPICMDDIDQLCNKITTECGHTFHCSCLMRNVAHNGFACPYCRCAMTDVPEQVRRGGIIEDEWIDDEDDETTFGDDALTSFRMFHQQINGEEVEEEPELEDDEEWVDEDDDEETATEEDLMPDAEYVTQRLLERGVTIDKLVKYILCVDHTDDNDDTYSEYQYTASRLYGQFRAIIAQYSRNSVTIRQQEVVSNMNPNPVPLLDMPVPRIAPTNNAPSPAQTSPATRPSQNQTQQLPTIAESKNSTFSRRREYL